MAVGPPPPASAMRELDDNDLLELAAEMDTMAEQLDAGARLIRKFLKKEATDA